MKRFLTLFIAISCALFLYAAEIKTYTSNSEYFPFSFKYNSEWTLNSSPGSAFPYITMTKNVSAIEIKPGMYPDDPYYNVLKKTEKVTNLLVSTYITNFRKRNKTKQRPIEDVIQAVTINGLKGSYSDVEFTAADGTEAYYMVWILYQPDYCYLINGVVPKKDSNSIREFREIARSFKLTGTPKPF